MRRYAAQRQVNVRRRTAYISPLAAGVSGTVRGRTFHRIGTFLKSICAIVASVLNDNMVNHTDVLFLCDSRDTNIFKGHSCDSGNDPSETGPTKDRLVCGE